MAHTSPQGIYGPIAEPKQERDTQVASLFEEHADGHSRKQREIPNTTTQGLELNVYSHCYGD
jgi:hypothetical protein